MSVHAMAWALDVPLDALPNATARHVLLVLANYAGEDGRGAFPSVATITRQTGLSRRAVQNNLTLLADSSIIRPGNPLIAAAWIGRPDQRPNVWDLSLERGAADTPRGVNGVHLTTERGAGGAPEPSLTVISIGSAAAGAEIPVELTPEVWARWDAYRRKLSRKKWTVEAAQLSFRTLAGLVAAGHPPLKVIEQSIEHSWTGLFPLKNNDGANRGTSFNRTGGSAAARVASINAEHDRRESGRR